MLNEKVYPVYLYAGKDHSEIKKNIAFLEKKVFPKTDNKDNIDIITFFGEECEIENIILECNTYAVFSKLKIVKIFNSDVLEKKKLLELINKLCDTTILILITSKSEKEFAKELVESIKKKGKVIFFKEKYENEARELLTKKLTELQISFELEVISYIVEQAENYDGNLNALIETIQNYCHTSKELLISDIPNILNINKIPSIFDFLNALFSKDIPKSFRLFHHLIIEDDNYGRIISMIFRQLKLIWEVKSYSVQRISQYEYSKKLNLPSFIVQQITKQANKFSFSHIETLFHELAQLDFSVKSSDKKHYATQFELYISKYAMTN